MTNVEAVVLSLVLAWLLLTAYGKKSSKASPIGGLLVKGKDGSIALKLWPATKKRKR